MHPPALTPTHAYTYFLTDAQIHKPSCVHLPLRTRIKTRKNLPPQYRHHGHYHHHYYNRNHYLSPPAVTTYYHWL